VGGTSSRNTHNVNSLQTRPRTIPYGRNKKKPEKRKKKMAAGVRGRRQRRGRRRIRGLPNVDGRINRPGQKLTVLALQPRSPRGSRRSPSLKKPAATARRTRYFRRVLTKISGERLGKYTAAKAKVATKVTADCRQYLAGVTKSTPQERR